MSDHKKPSTRSSIRQSLGKAFADVINKDNRDPPKPTKKTKDARRSSLVVTAIPAPRQSISGDIRPPSEASRRTATPEAKTVTSRRRVSGSIQRSSSEEHSGRDGPATPAASSSSAKLATLRPRTNATSALPKYRPKSAIETEKPPSPTRAGTRRPFSSSDDEGKKEQTRPSFAISSNDKAGRPISPLPQRAALKTNLTNSINTSATPPSTPSKLANRTTPSPSKASPSRPAKMSKTTGGNTAIPRPPSSSASSASLRRDNNNQTPHAATPKSGKPPSQGSRSNQETTKPNVTPLGRSPLPPMRDTPSPLAGRSKGIRAANSSSASSGTGNMSHIMEADSEDEEEADNVALLLAPAAPLGAPTPAMPRIMTSRPRLRPLNTPTKVNGLPSRANLSYVSPNPPRIVTASSSGSSNTGKIRNGKFAAAAAAAAAAASSSSLRPPSANMAGAAARAARTSIMSWEQLADEASRTLGEDEISRMLADVPAPFRSGHASPSLSSMDIPESPCLSALDSPGGYGSISQVLLPDVTPSPAMNSSMQQARFSLTPDAAAVESASSTVTMLRLQLASAENKAQERLYQMQAMEEEIMELKQTHLQQMEETEKHLAYVEEQNRRADEAQMDFVESLRGQLSEADAQRQRCVQEAVERCRADMREEARLRCEAVTVAKVAGSKWDSCRDACEMELSSIEGDKAVLSCLFAELDQLLERVTMLS